jgi:hypothetical protein
MGPTHCLICKTLVFDHIVHTIYNVVLATLHSNNIVNIIYNADI